MTASPWLSIPRPLLSFRLVKWHSSLCGRQDMNLHEFPHQDLKPSLAVFLVLPGGGKRCLSWDFAIRRVGGWWPVSACFAQFR